MINIFVDNFFLNVVWYNRFFVFLHVETSEYIQKIIINQNNRKNDSTNRKKQRL